MAVTPTIQNVKPVVGASADTWGGTINDRITETYTDITDIAAQFNVTQAIAVNAKAVADAALPRSGGVMTGQLVLENSAPTSQYASGFRGSPVVDFTGTKVLALTEAGKTVRLTGTGGGVVQISNIAAVAFPVGTIINIRNFSTLGQITVQNAPGSSVAIRKAGDATTGDKSISPQGFVRLIHESTDIWFIEGTGIT